MTKDFYIFRHGQSTYNLIGRTQGHTNDSVLTELGQEQAAGIGQKLKDKGIELIVTSPLKRARQTAELANQSLNVNIVEDERFIEINVGCVEGWPQDKILSQYKDIYDKLHNVVPDENICYPGGETKKQVRERVFAGLEYWVSQKDYDVIAISSHGIALAQTMIALGQSCQNVSNGAILHLKKENDTWQIIGWI